MGPWSFGRNDMFYTDMFLIITCIQWYLKEVYLVTAVVNVGHKLSVEAIEGSPSLQLGKQSRVSPLEVVPICCQWVSNLLPMFLTWYQNPFSAPDQLPPLWHTHSICLTSVPQPPLLCKPGQLCHWAPCAAASTAKLCTYWKQPSLAHGTAQSLGSILSVWYSKLSKLWN